MINKQKTWKLIDSNGKVIEYFRNFNSAKDFLVKIKRGYFGEKLEVIKNE